MMKVSLAPLVIFMTLALELRAPALALDNDCEGTPPNAVMTLPAPLSKWGRVSCTPFGHILTSHEGWVWVLPDGASSVLIPSQLGVQSPRPLGNKRRRIRGSVQYVSQRARRQGAKTGGLSGQSRNGFGKVASHVFLRLRYLCLGDRVRRE